MAGRKAPVIREWIVPVRYTYDGWAIVRAKSKEEAERLARDYGGVMEDGADLVDWETRGPARETT